MGGDPITTYPSPGMILSSKYVSGGGGKGRGSNPSGWSLPKVSFKLYLDNKGVGAHDVVPNEEHIVSLAHQNMGPGLVGSLGRSPGRFQFTIQWCPSTRGNSGAVVWGFESGE